VTVQWKLAVLLSIAVLYFLDSNLVARSVSQLTILSLAAIVVVMTLDCVMTAWKWGLLLDTLWVKMEIWAVVRFCYQGSFMNSFFSIGGNVLRAEVVSRSVGGRSEAYASILMERILGIVSEFNIAAIGAAVFAYFRSVDLSPLRLCAVLLGIKVANGAMVMSLDPRILEALTRRVQSVGPSLAISFMQKAYQA
jgi:hypothetical protein